MTGRLTTAQLGLKLDEIVHGLQVINETNAGIQKNQLQLAQHYADISKRLDRIEHGITKMVSLVEIMAAQDKAKGKALEAVDDIRSIFSGNGTGI